MSAPVSPASSAPSPGPQACLFFLCVLLGFGVCVCWFCLFSVLKGLFVSIVFGFGVFFG